MSLRITQVPVNILFSMIKSNPHFSYKPRIPLTLFHLQEQALILGQQDLFLYLVFTNNCSRQQLQPDLFPRYQRLTLRELFTKLIFPEKLLDLLLLSQVRLWLIKQRTKLEIWDRLYVVLVLRMRISIGISLKDQMRLGPPWLYLTWLALLLMWVLVRLSLVIRLNLLLQQISIHSVTYNNPHLVVKLNHLLLI